MRVPTVAGAVDPIPVGDQNGDGADDFVFGADLYSGRALMTSGRLPPPLRTLVGPVVGVLQLHANTAPSLVDVAGTERQPIVHVYDHSPIVLTAKDDPTGTDTTLASVDARVGGWIVASHRMVRLTVGDRSGSTMWQWDLDARRTP